jgi:DNA-binding Lrp family transcriptional regulator
MIQKLEKQGIIKDYTMIPDFVQLGFGLLTMTFFKYRVKLSSEERARARERIIETLGK